MAPVACVLKAIRVGVEDARGWLPTNSVLAGEATRHAPIAAYVLCGCMKGVAGKSHGGRGVVRVTTCDPKCENARKECSGR